jgi:5-(carboxyamino)imidazole ribonucleotide synthase
MSRAGESETAPRTRPVILPNSVGIVGAGQLARMLIEAAIPLDLTIRLHAATDTDGAVLLSPHVIVGPPAAYQPLARRAAECSVLTFDHELVDVQVLERLKHEGHCLRPSSRTLAIAQDKGRQRTLFAQRGLPAPAYAFVREAADVGRFGEVHGWPVVMKAARGGYDGRGVSSVSRPSDAVSATRIAAELLGAGIELLVEERVPIERELAVLVARRPGGERTVYPAAETVQRCPRAGICHEILAPAPIAVAVAEEAQRIALHVAAAADVTGIMALKLFLAADRLRINELATRPHNSGHYTIEGCITSQFENHLRAVLDWPLGDAGVRVHRYGKEPRPGRKVGHVTALGQEPVETRARAVRAAARLAVAGAALVEAGR